MVTSQEESDDQNAREAGNAPTETETCQNDGIQRPKQDGTIDAVQVQLVTDGGENGICSGSKVTDVALGPPRDGIDNQVGFYPYHYGPFASDLKGLSQVKVKFDKGIPFKPFDQLMAVLPPRSAHAIPGPLKQLMLDEMSKIIDFYPNDFEIDASGKRFLWQAICKLPFIEEERLLTETRKLETVLKDNEMERNAEMTEMLFVERSTLLGGFLLPLYRNGSPANQTDAIEIDASLSKELNGLVHLDDEELCEQGSDVLCAFYKAPSCCLLVPRPLEGVKFPIKIVDEADIVESTLWHEISGRTHSSSNMGRFNSWGPNPGGASSDGRTRWGRGRGKFNCFTTQSQTIPYSDVRNEWRGRLNNFVNPRNESARPIYRPQGNPRAPVPTVEYKGAGVGWGRGRGQQYCSKPELFRPNNFRPNTSTPWGSRETSSGSPWRSSNRGRPNSTPNYNAMSNKVTEIDAGLQKMSALHISTSAQNEVVSHSGVSLQPEAPLKQRGWWPSDRWDTR